MGEWQDFPWDGPRPLPAAAALMEKARDGDAGGEVRRRLDDAQDAEVTSIRSSPSRALILPSSLEVQFFDMVLKKTKYVRWP